jgi:hypothetical protein
MFLGFTGCFKAIFSAGKLPAVFLSIEMAKRQRNYRVWVVI